MIGIFGGTFDPIHFGHLRTALEVAEGCGMEQVRLIPGRVPPHRPQPQATAEQRLRMVELAIDGESRFVADRRELDREGESYSVDTIHSLRQSFGEQIPMAFVMGMDAFLSFRSWHRWQDIMRMVHLVVMHRPGYEPDVSDWFGSVHEASNCELAFKPAGKIAFQAVTQLDISATAIRDAAYQHKSLRYLLPDPVCDYINTQNLYQN